MTHQELKKLFQPIPPLPDPSRDARRTRFVGNLLDDFRQYAISAVLDLPDASEADRRVQMTVLEHLWQAYVLCLASHGVRVISFEDNVENMIVPKAASLL